MPDCRVLNEGKLLGCLTVVPGLMKYRLVGTTYVHAIPISSFSTRCGRVRTEETGSYVHCVNGLDQNADWYVNWHSVDRLSGAIVIYTLGVMPEGSFYVIHPVVRPLAILCVRNSSYSFHWN